MNETYSESAEGQTITKVRAIAELKKHGMIQADIAEFFRDLGDNATYSATAVLNWLGY